ncbi:hypothetical protein GCM10023156_54810 [Novipirellula rosea]|uniref:Uncharacterized protein n=1 Tax=Novipirellula rosea TaxID=1031540 RepID=A0ABP8NF17_9BACT
MRSHDQLERGIANPPNQDIQDRGIQERLDILLRIEPILDCPGTNDAGAKRIGGLKIHRRVCGLVTLRA